jgi:hypothetical protein
MRMANAGAMISQAEIALKIATVMRKGADLQTGLSEDKRIPLFHGRRRDREGGITDPANNLPFFNACPKSVVA